MEQADQFCTEKLKGKVFDAWTKWLSSSRGDTFNDEATQRSKLYSIFAAWKFYAKERSLLKRYLFECGETIDNNISQMTTI